MVARDGLLTYRNPASILQNDAASIHNSRDYLLTYGIPAMTQAVGRKLLGLNGQEYNLQDIISIRLKMFYGHELVRRLTIVGFTVM